MNNISVCVCMHACVMSLLVPKSMASFCLEDYAFPPHNSECVRARTVFSLK